MAIATQQVRWRAIQAYRSKQGSQETIAQMFQVSRRTFQLWLKQYDENKQLAPLPRGHNPSAFRGKLLEELDKYVEKNSDATLEKIQSHFAGRVDCTLQTVHNTLRRLGWDYKKSRYERVSKIETT